MKVEKVFTDNFYEDRYVKVDGFILTEKEALEYYPYLTESILMVRNQVFNPALPHIKKTYNIYPNNKMIFDYLLKEKDKIFNKLEGKYNFFSRSQKEQSRLIFNHLAGELTYDMSTLEDISKEFQNINILINKAVSTAKQIEASAKNLTNLLDPKEKKKHAELIYEKEATLLDLIQKKDRMSLKLIYSSLVQKKGVCWGFSYAYHFLLKEAGIENYILEIDEGEEANHSLNIIEFKDRDIIQYILADVTTGVESFGKTQEIQGFGINPEGYKQHKNYKIDRLEKMREKNSLTLYSPFVYEVKNQEYIKRILKGKVKAEIKEEEIHL